MLPLINLISCLYSLLVQGLPSLLGHKLEGQGLRAVLLPCASPGVVSSTDTSERVECFTVWEDVSGPLAGMLP